MGTQELDPRKESTMWNERLVRIGGAAGILAAQCMIVVIVANATASLPNFKFDDAETFLRQLYDSRAIMSAYGWTWILAIGATIPFMLGLYEVLRRQGTIVLVAMSILVAGMAAIGISYILTLVATLDLAPHFIEGDEATKTAITTLTSALWTANSIIWFIGGISTWGVATALFSVIALRTEQIPKWVSRLGLGAASLSVFWVGLILPNSELFLPFISINMLANVIWMIALGLVMLRDLVSVPAPVPVPG